MNAQNLSDENLYQTWEEDPIHKTPNWTLKMFTYLKFIEEGKLFYLDSYGSIKQEVNFDTSLNVISINESLKIELKSINKNELVLNFIHQNGFFEKKFIPKLKTKTNFSIQEIDKKIRSGVWSGSLIHEIGGKATFELQEHSSGKIALTIATRFEEDEEPMLGELREFNGTIFFEHQLYEGVTDRIQIFEVNKTQIIIGIGKREHQLIMTKK